MKQQSDWMKGLLWAENYIQEGVFLEDDETGAESLHWELYYSGDYTCEDVIRNEWFLGAKGYLGYYKEKLL